MSPILVHIHAYYPELLPGMLEKLDSLLPAQREVVVTTVAEHVATVQAMVAGIGNCRVQEVENRGYDIAPFLEVIKGIELEQYSYVMKLHTKRNMPGDVYLKPLPYNYGFERWREYLMNICRPEHFQAAMRAFEQQARLGMVADFRLIWQQEEPRFRAALDRLLSRAGLHKRGYAYIMGSMFICRAALLTPLLRLELRPQDFAPPDAAHSENLAHEIERFLGLSVLAQGYSIGDPFTPRWKQGKLLRLLQQAAMFLCFRKRGGDGSCIIKICKIPVFRKRGAKARASRH
ncbi:MAG: hypothetical protein IKA55_05680 [Akkermansia sp.]|nr:hypothetical protein [Akkermansia sp.]